MDSVTGPVVMASITGKQSFSVRFPSLAPVMVSVTGILFFLRCQDCRARSRPAINSASSIVLIRRHSLVISLCEPHKRCRASAADSRHFLRNPSG